MYREVESITASYTHLKMLYSMKLKTQFQQSCKILGNKEPCLCTLLQARPFTQKARGKGSGLTLRVVLFTLMAMKIVAGMRSNLRHRGVLSTRGGKCHHHELT